VRREKTESVRYDANVTESVRYDVSLTESVCA
jgi:hypothetical protein